MHDGDEGCRRRHRPLRSGRLRAVVVSDMADDAIVFAMANPTPEVMPGDAPANVAVVATGRSDFPNQINNSLAFPGVFRGLLDSGATRCTPAMKLAAAARARRAVPTRPPSDHARCVRGRASPMPSRPPSCAPWPGGHRSRLSRARSGQSPSAASSAATLARARASHRARAGALANNGGRPSRPPRTAARPVATRRRRGGRTRRGRR